MADSFGSELHALHNALLEALGLARRTDGQLTTVTIRGDNQVNELRAAKSAGYICLWKHCFQCAFLGINSFD
jgi:hypothetical protein